MTDEDRGAAKAIFFAVAISAVIVFFVGRALYRWYTNKKIETEQERIGRIFFDD